MRAKTAGLRRQAFAKTSRGQACEETQDCRWSFISHLLREFPPDASLVLLL